MVSPMVMLLGFILVLSLKNPWLLMVFGMPAALALNPLASWLRENEMKLPSMVVPKGSLDIYARPSFHRTMGGRTGIPWRVGFFVMVIPGCLLLVGWVALAFKSLASLLGID